MGGQVNKRKEEEIFLKNTVHNYNFGRSKIAVQNHNFGRYKIKVHSRYFIRSKITFNNRNFGRSNITVHNYNLEWFKLNPTTVNFDSPIRGWSIFSDIRCPF